VGRYGLDSSGLGYGLLAGCCEHGNEPSGCIICWEFLDDVTDYKLLKNDSAAWS